MLLKQKMKRKGRKGRKITFNIWRTRKWIVSYLLLAFFSIILIACFQGIINSINYCMNDNLIEKPKTSDFWVLDPILIDDLSLNNWISFEGESWLSGNGTSGNPYIIENVTIVGESNQDCIEIRNSNIHFIIRNCTLRDSGDNGITLYNTSNGQIIENSCNSNEFGIHLDKNCIDNIISGNTVKYNDIGIFLGHVFLSSTNNNNNIISGNIIRSNSEHGIYLRSDCNDNNISGNDISYFLDHGIYLSNDCDDNTISENNVTKVFSTDDRGIYLYSDCDNNTIWGNRVRTSESSLYHHRGYGIYLSGCDDNSILENILIDLDYGFYFSSSSDDNIISGNTIVDINYGIYLRGQHCIISENVVNESRECGMNIRGNNNTIFGNQVCENDEYGIVLDTCVNATLFGNDIRGGGLSVSGPRSYLQSHDINASNMVNEKALYYYVDEIGLDVTDFQNAGQAFLINCSHSTISGLNISNTRIPINLCYSSHNNISENDLSHNAEYGLYLYDRCENNTISGNEISYNDDYGIYLYDNCDENIISGNTIIDNHYGMCLNYSCYYNTISGNTINDTLRGIYLYRYCSRNNLSVNIINGADTGIYVYDHCDRNTISENTINIDDDEGYLGIALNDECDDGIISGNLISNYQRGISFYNCSAISLADNEIYRGGLYMWGLKSQLDSHEIDTSNIVNDKPIYYYSDETQLDANDFINAGQVFLINCSHSTVSGLNISNTICTIFLYGSYNNTIAGNLARENYLGIFLCFSSNNNTISGNIIYNNTEGIYLTYDSNENDILINNVSNNDNGIYINSCDYGTISGNNFSLNEYGIFLNSYCHYITISENNVNNNSYGIYLDHSHNNTISGNNASYNEYGIYFDYYCYYNDILDNNISYNDDGIYVFFNGHDTKISGNTINSNNNYGIIIRSNDNNIISGNHIMNNTRGIYLQSCDDSTIFSNSINNNSDYGVFLYTSCNDNMIYNNIIAQNMINGRDDGTENQWDNRTIGNYWSNYIGVDEEEPYGIGDTPYNITGTAGAQDKYPIISSLQFADFIVNATRILESGWIQFTYTGTGGMGDLTFLWDFGDGQTSTEQDPIHQYLTAGLYTINLTVIDEIDDEETESKNDFILVEVDTSPSVNFTVNKMSIVEGETIQFSYTGTGGNAPLSFLWDFGDGETSTEQDPMHQHTTAGNYTISLTVIDDDGDSNTEIKTSYIIVTVPSSDEGGSGIDLLLLFFFFGPIALIIILISLCFKTRK